MSRCMFIITVGPMKCHIKMLRTGGRESENGGHVLKDTTSRSCATATAQGGYMILVQLEVKGIKQHNHTAHGTAETARLVVY